MSVAGKYWLRFLASGVLFILYLVISTSGIYEDAINPDGINWLNRTERFTQGLKSGGYGDTYQAYHPGVTLMWISGPVLDLFHDLPDMSDLSSSEEKMIFLERDFYAKLSLIVFTSVVFAITYILLWKLVSFKYAFLFSVIFLLEPFILGTRRLYHLDYLLAVLIFVTFLFLFYFVFKSQKWYLVSLGGLFYAMALLTKSSAVIVLPAVLAIFGFGKLILKKKILSLLLFLFSTISFIYILFPAVWENPMKSFPKIYERIATGVSDIGLEGRKEVGFSGKGKNITLESTLGDKGKSYYLASLYMRLSSVGSFFLLISVGFYLYVFGKGCWQFFNELKSSSKLPNVGNFSISSWFSFWSLGISVAIIVALTLATKKSDRYLVMAMPFLIVMITYFLNQIPSIFATIVVLFYLLVTSHQLKEIYPYYIAYSNPMLGGIYTRFHALDAAPFGIGVYEAFEIVKDDMKKNNYDGYFTISGSKSVKAISAGGKFSRYPSCVTDYTIVFSDDVPPIDRCNQKHVRIGSVRIYDFDYWDVYKRLNQKHQSNYD